MERGLGRVETRWQDSEEVVVTLLKDESQSKAMARRRMSRGGARETSRRQNGLSLVTGCRMWVENDAAALKEVERNSPLFKGGL